MEKKICKLYEQQPSISSRDVGRKLGSCQANVRKIKGMRNGHILWEKNVKAHYGATLSCYQML